MIVSLVQPTSKQNPTGPICRSSDPFLSLTCIVNSSLTSLPLSSLPSHPPTHPQLSPSYRLKRHQPLTLVSPHQETHREPSKHFHTLRGPLKDQDPSFFSPFLTSLLWPSPTCAASGWLDFCKGAVPLPPQRLDWQVRAAVHASDGFTWGVCAQRGRRRGHIYPVCFSHCHCCSSPWFLRSVSSLGRHPSTGAFTLCSCSWLGKAEMSKAEKLHQGFLLVLEFGVLQRA